MLTLQIYRTKTGYNLQEYGVAKILLGTYPKTVIFILDIVAAYRTRTSVRDPDPHVFGPPGSGSISQRYGSGSGYGSFPYLINYKCLERTEIMLAKQNFNTKVKKKIKFLRLKIMCLWVSYKKTI